MLPSDLRLEVQIVGGSGKYVVTPADLPRSFDLQAWCVEQGKDAGTGIDDAGTLAGAMICTFAYDTDLTIHIQAGGYVTIDDTAKKKSACKGDDVSVSYMLQRVN